jgi:hypothetical protein
LYKSANFDEDLEEPGTTAQQAGRGRGVGQGTGKGIARVVGSIKVQVKKPRILNKILPTASAGALLSQ